MRTSARQPDTDHSQPKDIITKPKPLLITLAAVSALAASAANAAQVVVTTGASYVKMVDALAALYQKETGVAVETSFGGNIGRYVFHINYYTLLGVLAGANTNPIWGKAERIGSRSIKLFKEKQYCRSNRRSSGRSMPTGSRDSWH